MKADITHLTLSYSPDRTIAIFTGSQGLEIFHLEMEKRNNKDFADFLVAKGIISSEQCHSINAMIDSVDPEDYNVAKILLQEKSKELSIWR